MKYSMTFAALAGSAVAATCGGEPCADSIAAVPSCAIPCIQSAAADVANCGPQDHECQCANAEEIQGVAVNCVIGACGIETGLQVLPAVDSLCECVSAHPVTACATEATTATSAAETTVVETTAVETTAVETTAVETTGSSPASTIVSSIPTITSAATSNVVTGTGNAHWSTGGFNATTTPITYTSTYTSTQTYTITSCAPTVTDCPVGHVTTDITTVTTTWCPATESGPSKTSTAPATTETEDECDDEDEDEDSTTSHPGHKATETTSHPGHKVTETGGNGGHGSQTTAKPTLSEKPTTMPGGWVSSTTKAHCPGCDNGNGGDNGGDNGDDNGNGGGNNGGDNSGHGVTSKPSGGLTHTPTSSTLIPTAAAAVNNAGVMGGLVGAIALVAAAL